MLFAAVGCTLNLSMIDAGGIALVLQLVSILLLLLLLDELAKVTIDSLSASCTAFEGVWLAPAEVAVFIVTDVALVLGPVSVPSSSTVGVLRLFC